MKIYLLAAVLFVTTLSFSQTIDDIKAPEDDRSTGYEIGGGYTYYSLGWYGKFMGPALSFKINVPSGKFATVFNASYAFGTPAQSKSILASTYPEYPESSFYSDISYNFLRVGPSFEIALYNRTNLLGFNCSLLAGVYYFNSLKSGGYTSFLDKPGAPAIDTSHYSWVSPSLEFRNTGHKVQKLMGDVGFNFSYTFSRIQIYANASFMSDFLDVFKDDPYIPQDFDSFIKQPEFSYTFNVGVRFCLYQPLDKDTPDPDDGYDNNGGGYRRGSGGGGGGGNRRIPNGRNY